MLFYDAGTDATTTHGNRRQSTQRCARGTTQQERRKQRTHEREIDERSDEAPRLNGKQNEGHVEYLEISRNKWPGRPLFKWGAVGP